MPFPDELSPIGVEVLAYQQTWADEAHELAARLRELIPDAVAVEHIGSTSIPGMSAKDCLDMMIVVTDLDTTTAGTSLTKAGFRRRPEPWNNDEPAQDRLWPKMVFAPPIVAVRLTSTCGWRVRPPHDWLCCSATFSG
ncbi:GrpB family protein [Flexivirga alba]|uniref:GrpB family protein n=1 Tax=Flexivirga alba TaxID=702742 RepID=A0ABW2ALN2_9MICO